MARLSSVAQGLLLAMTWALVTAHLCVMYPPQRGRIDIAWPGSAPCYRPYAECGRQVDPPSPDTTVQGGATLTVRLQQNFNHWYPQNPGWLDAALAVKVPITNTTKWLPFGNRVPDFNANNMVTQTNFTITDVVPNMDCSHCVLRVRYVSNNPEEVLPNNPDAIFFQCADIRIKSNPNLPKTSGFF